jgi:tetratricopeptide (TPR) repeat protein
MTRLLYISLGIFLFAGAQSLAAQQINPRVPPPPPPAEAPAAAQPAAAPPAAAAPPSAAPRPIDPSVPPPPPTEEDTTEAPASPLGPVFDPLHAQRSVNIGTFYLNKGSYDAAIDRFLEASNYQPSLASPWKLLGEAYEKKHEYAKSADAYKKYLQIAPHASDTAKITKLVSELEEKAVQESPKNAQR